MTRTVSPAGILLRPPVDCVAVFVPGITMSTNRSSTVNTWYNYVYKQNSQYCLRPDFFYLLEYVTRQSENWDFNKEKKMEIQW